MDLAAITDGADRFVAYIEELTSVIGHADRALPLRDYCAGLLTAEGRKSVEPMAAVTAPARVSVQHQKLLHFVGFRILPRRFHSGSWSTSPKCAGASSATTRTSSRRSGSATMKAAAGEVSTITARCVSQPMD